MGFFVDYCFQNVPHLLTARWHDEPDTRSIATDTRHGTERLTCRTAKAMRTAVARSRTFVAMAHSGGDGTEARDAYRAGVSFPSAYRLEGEEATATGEMREISAAGAQFICDRLFAIGALVELRFTLPEGLLAPVRVEETYEWGRPYQRHTSRILRGPAPFAPMTISAQIAGEGAPLGGGRYAYGVAFSHLDAATREEIHRFVHLWQRRQLRVRRAQRESS